MKRSKLILLLKAFILIAFALIGAMGWYISQSSHEAGPEGGSASQLRKAPSFELKDAHGRVRALPELKDQAVIIHFWASWCPPCLGEIPIWLEFARRLEGKPIRFVAISLDQNWADASKMLSASQLPSNVWSLLDTSLKVPDAYGSYQFPETYLLNRKHEVLMKWVGPQEWNTQPQIQRIVEEAMKP